MATQTYDLSGSEARIGKMKGEILKSAMPVEVLASTGVQKQMPKNKGEQIVFRRWKQYGGLENQFLTATATNNAGDTFASDHILTEGVTPSADTIVPVDYTATLVEYGALYALTNKTAEVYEDDIPAEMTRQVGKRIGLVREMVRYGILKGNTTVHRPGGATSTATVASAVTKDMLRSVARTLESNHATMVTDILAPSPNFGTQAIEAAYLVFCHTDCESDIRDLANFTPVAEYGQRKPVHERELGSFENFRFITSPELVPILDAGAAVGATGLKANSTNVDVYPMLVVAEDAWGQVALRGLDSIDPTYIKPNQKDSSDPLGQRGYIGCRTYFACTELNPGWYATCEVGVSAI